MSVLVGISQPPGRENGYFQDLHFRRFSIGLVIEADEMQETMHHEVGPVSSFCFTLVSSLATDDRRTNHQVAEYRLFH